MTKNEKISYTAGFNTGVKQTEDKYKYSAEQYREMISKIQDFLELDNIQVSDYEKVFDIVLPHIPY